MMHHQAGVKVVAVGGRPTTGPMQGVAAGRGARSYSLSVLDANINFAQSLLASAGSPDANFLPNRTTANDVYIIDAGVNLRDQVRQDEETPLQFTYEAADCRIFWTPKTIFNYAALWQYTADAVWRNASLCVAGSTGYSGNASKDKDDESPALPVPSPDPSSFNMTEYLSSLNKQTPPVDSSDLENDLSAGGNVYGRARSATFRDCSKNASGNYYCSQGYQCLNVQRCASSSTLSPTCVETCNYPPGTACGGGTCDSKQVSGKPTVGQQSRYSGYCRPKPASCLANGMLITRREGEII